MTPAPRQDDDEVELSPVADLRQVGQVGEAALPLQAQINTDDQAAEILSLKKQLREAKATIDRLSETQRRAMPPNNNNEEALLAAGDFPEIDEEMGLVEDDKAHMIDSRSRQHSLSKLLGGEGDAAAEGVQKAAAGDDDPYSLQSYFGKSTWSIYRGRALWLIGLLLLQSMSAEIMEHFDDLLDKHIVIAFFVPMLVGTGGNAGNQPGVMVTRAITELRGNRAQIGALLRKETALALMTASTLAGVGGLRVAMHYHDDWEAVLAISLSLFAVILVAVFLGIGFSLLLDRMNIDPANGAAPLLTTVSDLIGIVVLCSVSSLIFSDPAADVPNV